MRKALQKILTICVCGCVACTAMQSTTAFDYGFPLLNAGGRYFGAGWSHHTFHSNVHARFPFQNKRSYSTYYPSNALTYPYSPHYQSENPNGCRYGSDYGVSPHPGLSPLNHWQPQFYPTTAPTIALPRSTTPNDNPRSSDLPQPNFDKPDGKPSGEDPPSLQPDSKSPSDRWQSDEDADDSKLLELEPSPDDSTTNRSYRRHQATIVNRYSTR